MKTIAIIVITGLIAFISYKIYKMFNKKNKTTNNTSGGGRDVPTDDDNEIKPDRDNQNIY